MRRAHPQELREDARPALLLSVSESRLRELFPVRFTRMDPAAEAEPSKGSLVRLESDDYAVVVYGTVTRRATVSFPVSADVHAALGALFREVPVRDSEILWTVEADAPRRARAR
jgi:hypothetical protein